MTDNPAQPATTEHSEVLVFPPVIPVTGFLLGVLLERLWPTRRWISAAPGVRVAGGILLAIGVAGFAWMVITMKQAGTPIHNSKTPLSLVESGPFRLTRNPMYLFGTVAYAGLALVLAQLWSLALLPLVFALTHYGVVLREEAFLQRHFGTAYSGYCRRVRRWL